MTHGDVERAERRRELRDAAKPRIRAAVDDNDELERPYRDAVSLDLTRHIGEVRRQVPAGGEDRRQMGVLPPFARRAAMSRRRPAEPLWAMRTAPTSIASKKHDITNAVKSSPESDPIMIRRGSSIVAVATLFMSGRTTC